LLKETVEGVALGISMERSLNGDIIAFLILGSVRK
jgi:hypothetical protein